jgi:hypothetical protein
MIRNVQGREKNGVFSPVSTENRERDRRQHENTKKGSVQEMASGLLQTRRGTETQQGVTRKRIKDIIVEQRKEERKKKGKEKRKCMNKTALRITNK